MINLGFEDSSINAGDDVMVVNEVSDSANAIQPAGGIILAGGSRGSGGGAAAAARMSQQKSNIGSKSSGINRTETMQLVESSEALDLKK